MTTLQSLPLLRGGWPLIQTCPIKSYKSVPHQPHMMLLPERDQLHVPLPLQLQLSGKTILVSAIIDSGACSCFVDSAFLTLHQLPVCNKRQGFTVHSRRLWYQIMAGYARDCIHFLQNFLGSSRTSQFGCFNLAYVSYHPWPTIVEGP